MAPVLRWTAVPSGFSVGTVPGRGYPPLWFSLSAEMRRPVLVDDRVSAVRLPEVGTEGAALTVMDERYAPLAGKVDGAEAPAAAR